ncbi:MAG: DNA-3-methyladenine glycosylase [Chloroflexota bacterium]
MSKLPREFFARPSPIVAPELLGKILVHHLPEGVAAGRIVEVEAYTGQTDPGSHAYRGMTPRNTVMFGPPGYVYVYTSYGVHACMNVVTETPGVAGAVLIRALEPLQGLAIMEERRSARRQRDLANGPGKLCRALGISVSMDGTDLEGSELWIDDDGYRPEDIAVSRRIGLSQGSELPLRFYIPGNRFVSRGRPADQET